MCLSRTIRNHVTGQIVPLSRDARTGYPNWIHEQLHDADDFAPTPHYSDERLEREIESIYGDDCVGKGRDCCGVEVTR